MGAGICPHHVFGSKGNLKFYHIVINGYLAVHIDAVQIIEFDLLIHELIVLTYQKC
jgi:hypothetical protein